MRHPTPSLLALLVALFAGGLQAQERTTSPHGDLQTQCTVCHGPNSWTALQISSQFDHDKLGFRLTGAHGATTCRACHISLEFKLVRTDCTACHEDNHRGELGPSCVRCHTTRTFVDRDLMVPAHRLTRFPLSGGHLAVECTMCHTPGAQGQMQFVGTPTACFSCHQPIYNAAANHVASNFPTTCEGCHSTVAWNAANLGAGNHPTSPIALSGVHSGNLVTCTQCHTSLPYSTVDRTCDGCHHAEYVSTTDPNHSAAGYSTDCASCHQPVANWAGAKFDHPVSPIALTGAHSVNLVECTQCHTSQPYSAVKQTCDGCHHAEYLATTDPNHVAAAYSTDCASCHQVVANWTGATANHPTSPIALTGVHSANLIPCTQCHTTTPYSTVKQTCDGCHHAEYVSTSDPNHLSAGYGTDCASCHQPVANWAGANANHPTTPIALTGVHSANIVTCTQCHTTSPYSSVQRSCDGCHHAEYVQPTDPNHVLANFSTTCTACHGLVANWAGAKFTAHDGSVSQFRIYSGQHSNRWSNCAECHAAGQSYAATPALLCLNCHAQVQTDQHRGQNYTPSDCVRSGCHANGSNP